MAPTKSEKSASPKPPSILVVDDEPMLIELVDDLLGAKVACRTISASSLCEARKILSSQTIELLVTDVNLPDGNGTTLLDSLREHQPTASAIVITGQPSMDGAINAMRHGAFDFLPKPFTADNLVQRVTDALAKQKVDAKKERRLGRLRVAVKRLNDSRRLVSKKVDLLCNDLITAYGELSRQLDIVRTQESFRKTLDESKDLEQLLCHAMDWMMRQIGYSNVAIWLASEDQEYQLGAYMKYTVPGEPALTDAMKIGVLPIVNRDGFLHLDNADVKKHLTSAELKHMSEQTVLAVNCTYLGESLGAIILFRDQKTPFTADDAATLKAISPIFATKLTAMVHGAESDDEDDEGFAAGDSAFADDDEDRPKKKPTKRDADWWKRGEPPPF